MQDCLIKLNDHPYYSRRFGMVRSVKRKKSFVMVLNDDHLFLITYDLVADEREMYVTRGETTKMNHIPRSN